MLSRFVLFSVVFLSTVLVSSKGLAEPHVPGPVLLIPKIVDFFTKSSDQRERFFTAVRQHRSGWRPCRHVFFVQDGVAADTIVIGKKWQQGDGYLESSGVHNYLYAGKALASGDVHIRARIALVNIAGSAASFAVDTRDHFGFDGAGEVEMFVSGPMFGKLKSIGVHSDFIQEARPFELELIRKKRELRVLIDGKEVYQCSDRREEFGTIALRPWRATMRVYDFSASGNLEDAIIPADIRLGTEAPFSIPVIDLSGETERHVIVAQGTSDSYKGHPTTLLMPDSRTMFCVYPLGHGGPDAVLRRSDDGGLTWSDPLDTPDNWRQSNNCPALYRLVARRMVRR